MKRIFLPVCLNLLLLAACNSDKAKVKSIQTSEDGTTTTTTMDVQKVAETQDKSQQKVEELKKLAPLNLDQLKALLPDALNGMKRTDFNASSSMGYSVVEGTYQKNDTSNIKVTVYDCAGESGSAFYSLTYWSAMNFQQESDKEYTKTVDFNGAKAIENYKKTDNESSLTYVSNNRLLVVLNGTNTKPDELKSAAGNLNFKL